MDRLTDFGQIAIYNRLLGKARVPDNVDSPSDCIYGQQTYYALIDDDVQIPIMIGSSLHLESHPRDNPLKINGYFIIDGVCKSVSSMYMLDGVSYTKDRTYLSTGESINILETGEYKIKCKKNKKNWVFPVNYKDILEYSIDKEKLKSHFDLIVKRKDYRNLGKIIENEGDLISLCRMFETWIGIREEMEKRWRLVTSGELIHDMACRREDIIQCFRVHTWPVKNIRDVHSVSEDMKHYNIVGDIEAIRRITTPTQRENMRLDDRLVKIYNKNKLCPVQTSDGDHCGTIMYLTENAIIKDSVTDEFNPPPIDNNNGVSKHVFIDGKYKGLLKIDIDGVKRREGDIHFDEKVAMIWTRAGRVVPGDKILSHATSYIPFYNSNPAVRSMFSSSMIKQAITHDSRIKDGLFNDTSFLISGEQPKTGRVFPYPAGHNLVIAIMPWFGFNIEDAIVISEDTALRYSSEKYTVYRQRLKKIYNEKIINKKVKAGDFVSEKQALFTVYRPSEMVTIEEVVCNVSGKVSMVVDGDDSYIVKISHRKKLEVGDKMTSRHGQKGVVSLIVPSSLMPEYYDEEESKWKAIDLIMNPHAFPSRMTMGQLKEINSNSGRNVLEDPYEYKVRIPVESTSRYSHLPLKAEDPLSLQSKDKWIDVKHQIIVGTCYYMALRHQVFSKVQYRNTGEVDKTTKQAISGKARKGGLRFGQMERDILVGAGMWKVLGELWSIDKVYTYVCTECGLMQTCPDEGELCKLCPGKAEKTQCNQSLLICVGLLRGMGRDIRWFVSKMEYSIIEIGEQMINNFQKIDKDDLWFGETDPLETRVWNNKSDDVIFVLPMCLRSKYIQTLYSRMCSSKNMKSMIIDECEKMLTGKNGVYHTLVEGHRVNHCLRSVIVPNPLLATDTIETPLGSDIGSSYGIFNRQPSLSVKSMMLVRLKQGMNKTISFNPLLCSAFNADFDGDEMCIFGLNSEEAIEEAKQKLPPIETPTQDYIISSSRYSSFTSLCTQATNNDLLSLQSKDNLLKLTLDGLTSNRKGIELMITSGSKGKEFNYKHMFERIGEVTVSNTIVGEIKSCYWTGLSSEEWYYQAMAAREAAASIGVNTPYTGALQRTCNLNII